MGEWLKPAVLKTVSGVTRSGGRIPLPPPNYLPGCVGLYGFDRLLRYAMIAARSSCLGTRNPISLSGTMDSVSVNHLSNSASSQVTFAFCSASEYLKVFALAAGLPKTPRRRGPS